MGMTHADLLTTIPDDELFTTVQRLTARSNVTLADLLAHLGEVERRGIHRLRACASLYTYCMYELRMSEDAAFRRSKAARLVREYPQLREAIAKGEIHLTGVLMIGPYLGGDRHAEILQRVRFRSKREILRLIARIDPKPEVPSRVEPIGPAPVGRATQAAFAEALAGPVRELPKGSRPEQWIADAVEDTPVDSATNAEPELRAEAERPLRYKVQFTATQEFVDLLEEASALIGRGKPLPELPDIQLRALRALVKELRTRKRAQNTAPASPVRLDAENTEPPRLDAENTEPVRLDAENTEPVRLDDGNTAPARARTNVTAPATPARLGNRHIPASVVRVVWGRDGERCAYRDARGQRCREVCGLELHHRKAFALGGLPTVDNLELRCRPHNTLAAEQDFGRRHMDWMRGVEGDAAPERASPRD